MQVIFTEQDAWPSSYLLIFAAAELNLTQLYSPKSLIDVTAILSENGELLVKPNDAEESFLVKVLKDDIIQYNHTDVLPESELITLIEAWINNDAEE